MTSELLCSLTECCRSKRLGTLHTAADAAASVRDLTGALLEESYVTPEKTPFTFFIGTQS